jgi:hypothetical protein
MAKFLIQVPHEGDELSCARVVHVFLSSGSHFLTHAEWGCMDGDHTAWMIVDANKKDEARMIVPPAFRAQAKIVALNRFSMDQIDNILRRHRGSSGSSEPSL